MIQHIVVTLADFEALITAILPLFFDRRKCFDMVFIC